MIIMIINVAILLHPVLGLDLNMWVQFTAIQWWRLFAFLLVDFHLQLARSQRQPHQLIQLHILPLMSASVTIAQFQITS